MKKKLISVIFLLFIGFTIGAISTSSANANSNVVLASVEWVVSQLTPVENKLSALEQRVASLESGSEGEKPTQPPVTYSHIIVNSSTAIRRSASTKDTIFFTAPTGTSLVYNSTFTNSVTGEKWYIVELSDNRAGAILASDVSLQSQSVSTFSKVVVTKSAPVKRGADQSYENIYSASSSEVLQYSSTYTNSISGEKWYIVKTPSGKFGAILVSNAEVVK